MKFKWNINLHYLLLNEKKFMYVYSNTNSNSNSRLSILIPVSVGSPEADGKDFMFRRLEIVSSVAQDSGALLDELGCSS